MKILIVAGIFPPDIGGPAHYIPKLADSLFKIGHFVEVLTFSENLSEPKDSQYSFKVVRVARSQNIVFREFRAILIGIRMARNTDIVFANGNDFKAFLIGFFSKKPVVHKIVGDTSWERAQNRGWYKGTLDEYQIHKKPLKLIFLDWVRAFPLRNSVMVFTPSKYLQKIVRGWGVKEEKTKVIYNSMDPLLPVSLIVKEKFQKKLNPNLQYMCTICRLVPWKGLDNLILSLKDFPSLGLIIVGEGPLRSYLEDLAHQKGLADRILFTGKQSRSELSSILELSRFFILNSSYEGLPHVVLEAMSCKKLVLASRVGGTPEVVEHLKTGYLFSYNDPNEINKAIHWALDLDHTEIVDRAVNQFIDILDYQRMLNETEELLKNLVGGQR